MRFRRRQRALELSYQKQFNSKTPLTMPSAENVEAKNNVQDETTSMIHAAGKHHTKPLWLQMKRLNPPLPDPRCTPHLWKYSEIRPILLKAGNLVTESQAERRVLMLTNPSRGTCTHSLLIHQWDWKECRAKSSHTQMPLTRLTLSMPGFSSSCLMRPPRLIDRLHLL